MQVSLNLRSRVFDEMRRAGATRHARIAWNFGGTGCTISSQSRHVRGCAHTIGKLRADSKASLTAHVFGCAAQRPAKPSLDQVLVVRWSRLQSSWRSGELERPG